MPLNDTGSDWLQYSSAEVLNITNKITPAESSVDTVRGSYDHLLSVYTDGQSLSVLKNESVLIHGKDTTNCCAHNIHNAGQPFNSVHVVTVLSLSVDLSLSLCSALCSSLSLR